MSENKRVVQLDAELCRMAEERFRSRFANVEELLTFAMRELLRDEAAQMDRDEQRMIEERLKDLGYI